MRRLYYDSETYSELDLPSVGAHRYATQCEIMVHAYAINDGPVVGFDNTQGDPPPEELVDALMDPETLVIAHNAQFDRWVLKYQLLEIPVERWFDTMAQAYVHSLPGSLDTLCQIFRLSEADAKHSRGRELVNLFCKPRPKNHTLRRATRLTHPAEWEEFIEYAKSDVRSMRELTRRMPKWNLRVTRPDWVADQRINDRGVQIDVDLCRAAAPAAERERASLARLVQNETLGFVESATKRDQLIAFILEAYGVSLPDLRADTLERRIEDPELPEAVKVLLRARAQASLASVAKFKKAAGASDADQRLRGAIAFSGAQRTGRRAGRLVQPQNMPRTDKRYAKQIEDCVDAVKTGAVDLIYDHPMEVLRAVTRGIFVAAPRRKLTVVDWSNIEGRGLAWCAGETWKLWAFSEYDLGVGPDLYNVAYARSFNVAVESVDKEQRQIGKVQELALGYAGGVGAFVAMALVYRMDLEELAKQVLAVATYEQKLQSEYAWEWAVEKESKKGARKWTCGLPRHIFVACHILRTLWRKAHPNVVQWWSDLEEAFRNACEAPLGWSAKVGPVTFDRVGKWVRIRLPSGRFLSYAAANVTEKGDIRYRGISQYTKQWSWQYTHGGKLAENIVQAICGDILSGGIHTAEAHGYPVVLTVHDELITEPEDLPEYNSEHLAKLVSVTPEWAAGFPLSAAGYDAYRYRKE
jgi:DNA polymerase